MVTNHTHVFTVHEDGTITALHTDALPLESLGQLTIKRASTIEFNNTSQLWEVTLGSENMPRYWNRSRTACIEWEIEQLNGKV